MNLGTINDANAKTSVPPKAETKVEPKTQDSMASTAKQTTAAETHLSQLSIKQRSLQVLTGSMNEHFEKMTLIREHSVKSFASKSTHDISNLSTLNIDKQTSEAKPFFDFEEVAKNVLNFVGGALTGAAQSGAENETLMEMLGQARKGVSKGIDDARKILGDLVKEGDEVDQGINKANGLITGGFDRFERKIHDPEDDGIFSYEAQSIVSDTQVSNQRNAAFEIETREGDKVSVSFESLKAYQERYAANQQADYSEDENGSHYSYNLNEERSRTDFSTQAFAFAVEGELDKDELTAIGSLVKDISELANEFFNGDVEAAYKQAQELGFNDEEISGFSLDLQQRSTVQVTQAYQQVARYGGDEQGEGTLPDTIQRPLQDYASKLLDMVSQASEKLKDQEEIQNTIRELFSQQFKMSREELFAALERFNHFNQQIVGGNNDSQAVNNDDENTIVEQQKTDEA